MTPRLMCIGECMVEMAPLPDGNFKMGFAGDSFNTAWYAKQLGGNAIEVSYLSAIGDDDASRKLAGFIEGEGIRPELAIRPGRSVGLYMISLTNGERSFSYWRDSSAARSLADDLQDLPRLQQGDLALFTGITLAILPRTGRKQLLEVLAKARANGVQIAFDPNLRPKLWPDIDEMLHWIMEGAKVADIALPSFEDEGAYFGDDSPTATAARYRAAGVGCVVVKDGPREVLIVDKDESQTVTPARVEHIEDTTAAGDSFNAGFLVGRLTGQTLPEATAQACDLARKVIGKRGALVTV